MDVFGLHTWVENEFAWLLSPFWRQQVLYMRASERAGKQISKMLNGSAKKHFVREYHFVLRQLD